MATNNEKPEEKKTSTAKSVELKAEDKQKTAAPKKTSRNTTRKTTKKTTTSAKKTDTSVKKAASTTKKTSKKTGGEIKEKALNEVKVVEKKEKSDALKSGEVDRGALILGGGLLFMGLLLLVGRLLHIPFGTFIWPFIFIIPGVLIFLGALSTESSSGEGLSILGGILTTLGFVFLAQSVTGLWASWAYVWALVAPTSIGISQMVYGMRKDRDAIVQSGRRLANIGLTIFAVGFVFFEVILGISGYGLRSFGIPIFPMILIFMGAFILVITFIKKRD